jgi:glycosyltransferase involved in cell wall biosynthesis
LSGESTPLLSICIPTLNRAAFIGATLDSILAQLTKDVEIVIVDGGSQDDTAEVVGLRSAHTSAIRYHVSEHLAKCLPKPTDAGFDRDCDYCLKLARGKYCWILPDDDLMAPDAIRTVREYLASGMALVLVNTCVFDIGMVRCLEETRLAIHRDAIFKTGEDDRLFRLIGTCLTYVGGVIVRRDYWLRHARPEFYGSDFIHVLTLFSDPGDLDAIIVAKPLVNIRYGNAHWRHRAFKIWMFNWPALVWRLPLADTTKNEVVSQKPWRNLLTLILFRVRGAYGPEGFQRIKQEGCSGFFFELGARCVAWAPVFPLSAAFLSWYALTGRWSSINCSDVRAALENPFHLRWIRNRARAH